MATTTMVLMESHCELHSVCRAAACRTSGVDKRSGRPTESGQCGGHESKLLHATVP